MTARRNRRTFLPMRHGLQGLGVALIVLCMPPGAAANLSVNPGFETAGGGGDQDAADWTEFGIVHRESWAAESGSWGMAHHGWESGDGGMFQDISSDTNAHHYFRIRLRFEAQYASRTLEQKLEYFDSSFNLLVAYTNFIDTTSLNDGNWRSFDVDGVAEDDAAWVRPVVYFPGATPVGFGNQAATADNVMLYDRTKTYRAGEILEEFSYDDHPDIDDLHDKDRGGGWTNNWIESNTGAFSINSGSFGSVTGYPAPRGNKTLVTPPNDSSRSARRHFDGITTGRVYAAYLLNFQFDGADKFAGISFMEGSSELAFFGEVFSADETLGMSVTGHTATSSFMLNSGGGEDYVIIGMYDFGTRELRTVAYYKTATVPTNEPSSWDASITLGAGTITRVDGVRIAAGAGSGAGTPGNVFFDEVRVARSWHELMNLDAEPVWDGNGSDAAWDTVANWKGNVTPADSAVVTFYDSINSGTNINLNGNRTVEGLRFNDNADTSLRFINDTLTVNAAGVAIDSGAGGAHVVASAVSLGQGQRWTNASSQAFSVSGVMSGDADTLTKLGSGRVILSGNNTFTAAVTIAEGTLEIRNANGLGATGGGTVVSNGAALALNAEANYTAEPLTLNGTGESNGGALRKIDTGTRQFPGAVTLVSDARINTDGGSLDLRGDVDLDGNTLYVGGNFSTIMGAGSSLSGATKTTGDGALVKDGSSFFRLRPDAGLTGSILISEGELRIDVGTGGIPSGGVLTMEDGTSLSTATSTDRSSSKDMLINGDVSLAIVSSGNLTIGGAVDLNDGIRGITVGNTATMNGIISNGGLTKAGAGTLTLAAANTYAGNTRAAAGTLSLTHASALQNSILDMDGGDSGSVSFGSPSLFTLGGLAGSRNLDMGAKALSVGNNASNTTYSGVLSNGSLNKIGAGTLTLSGASTYSGDTVISNGTLVVLGSAPNSAFTVRSGATLAGSGPIGATFVFGAVSPGQSITNLAVDELTLEEDGEYVWEIADVSGTPGEEWDVITVDSGTGDVFVDATAGNPFTIRIDSMGGTPTGWSSASDYDWIIIDAGSVTDFSTDRFVLDTTDFDPDLDGGTFSIAEDSGNIVLSFTAAATANIDVYGNSQIITNNSAVPSLANHTDFGDVYTSGGTLTRTYTITNTASDSVGLGTVTTSGTHAADFVVVAQPAVSINAGATTTFQVQFDPSADGTRTATVSFTNTTSFKNPYSFTIQGTGVTPSIVRAPASLSPSSTLGSDPASDNFGVTNAGTGVLNYDVTTNQSWLSVSPVDGSLDPDEGQQHTVSYSGTAGLGVGVHNATITITSAEADNSPQTVSVELTINALPDPTNQDATSDGPEMVRLVWTKDAGYDVMIVFNATNAPAAPSQGTAYDAGDPVGSDGSHVVYKGDGSSLEHIVPELTTAHYAFYSVNNDYYSPGVAASASTPPFQDFMVIDPFAYTNLFSLSGAVGGKGWTNAWLVDDGTFTVVRNDGTQPEFQQFANYAEMSGNRVRLDDPGNNEGGRVIRNFDPITDGRIYAGYIFSYEFAGNNKYAGMSFLSNEVERAFYGMPGSSTNHLGLDSFGGSLTLSTYQLNSYQANTGNVYLVIGRYDFDTREFSTIAYYRTDSIDVSEPDTWAATATVPEGWITMINGIMIVGGAIEDSGVNIGNVFYDEIRVARSWNELLDLIEPLSVEFEVKAGDTVTDADVASGDFPVVFTWQHQQGFNTTDETAPFFRPNFDLYNTVGAQILTDQVFSAFEHLNAGTMLVASNESHAGALPSDITLGVYTARWSVITSNEIATINSEELKNPYWVHFDGDGETKAAYASNNVTLSGTDWSLDGVLIGSTGSDKFNGVRAGRLRRDTSQSPPEPGNLMMIEDKANGIGTISFLYARFGSDAVRTNIVEYSLNSGSTWTEVGRFHTDGVDTLTPFIARVDRPGDNARVRVRADPNGPSVTSGRRVNIEDIRITDFPVTNQTTFVVIDDDTEPPEAGTEAGESRGLMVSIGGTNVTAGAGTGAMDRRYDISDHELARIVGGGNLLTDPGFESGLAFWTQENDAHIEDWAAEHGQFGVGLHGWADNGTIRQDVPGLGNTDYELSARLRKEVNFTVGDVFVRMEFLDASSNLLSASEIDVVDDLTGGFQTFRHVATSHADTIYVRAMFGFRNAVDQGGADQGGHVDNASLTITGENPLRTIFSMYDAVSGLSRGTTDHTTQTFVNIGWLYTNNVENYVAAESSADTTITTSTSTWSWSHFNYSEIRELTLGTDSVVEVWMRNADFDRAEIDQESTNAIFGTIRVFDDDETLPERRDHRGPFDFANRPLQVSLEEGDLFDSGTGVDRMYRVSDGELANLSGTNIFRMSFGARDVDSGLSRNILGSTHDFMNISVGSVVVSNLSQFYLAESTDFAETTETSTNVWRWDAPFNQPAISNLLAAGGPDMIAGTNLVTATLTDADDDWPGDRGVVYDEQYGWLIVYDDDITEPEPGVELTGGSAWDFLIGDTNYYDSGAGTNVIFRVTDADLAGITGDNPMRFVFNVFDSVSGVSRSNSGDFNDFLNFDVGVSDPEHPTLQNIFETYSNGLSTADTTLSTATSVFYHPVSFTIGGFADPINGGNDGWNFVETGEVAFLIGAAPNPITVSAPNLDEDWGVGDREFLIDQQVGYLVVEAQYPDGPVAELLYAGPGYTPGTTNNLVVTDAQLLNNQVDFALEWSDPAGMFVIGNPGVQNLASPFGNVNPNFTLRRPDGQNLFLDAFHAPTSLFSDVVGEVLAVDSDTNVVAVEYATAFVEYEDNQLGTWQLEVSAQNLPGTRGQIIFTNLFANVITVDVARVVTTNQPLEFTVIDDDPNPPVGSGLAILPDDTTAIEAQAGFLHLLAGWNFNNAGDRFETSHGSGTASDTLTSTNHSGGTTVNAVSGDAAGDDLTVSGAGNIGASVRFEVSMAGHQDLVMTFAARRSDTGYNSNVVEYAINGGAFTVWQSDWTPTNVSGNAFGLNTFDFSSITDMNDAGTVAVRITFGVDGVTGGGNNRFDNFQFNANRTVHQVTDRQLAQVSAGNPLYYSFNVYDPTSGVYRGTTFDGTNMHISIEGKTTNDTTRYLAASSSADTFDPASTSLWRFTEFDYNQIGDLYGDGTNYIDILATLADRDNDRVGDTMWLSNHVFGTLHVIDNDTIPPRLTNINHSTQSGAANRPFFVTTNGVHLDGTIRGTSRRSGTLTNTVWAVTDEELALPADYDLQFAFGVIDTHSGISRADAGTTNSVLNFRLGDIYTDDFANFDLASSSANYTNASTTNVWTFANGAFSMAQIDALLNAGNNPVRLTMVDDDDDRPDDGAIVRMVQAGFLRVVDDDVEVPLISNLTINASSPGTLLVQTFDVYHGWTNSQAAYGNYSNHVNGDVWVGEDVIFTPLVAEEGRMSGLRVLGMRNEQARFTLPERDNPGTVFLWARLSGDPGADTYELRVEGTTNDWVDVIDYGDRTVSGTDFSLFAWTVQSNSTMSLRLRRVTVSNAVNRTIFIDDIGVTEYAAWTNAAEMDITWPNADDPSGVFGYGRVDEAPDWQRGSNTTEGTTLATNTANVSLSQGSITGFVYAVDNDNDRLNDRLRNAGLPYVVRIDRTPPAQVANVEVEEGFDDTSEIAVNWEALADAGGGDFGFGFDPLSPWRSYRVYYAEGDSGVTTNDDFISFQDISDLADIAYTNAVISNLIFDTTYSVAVAGEDEAGNIGTLSAFETVTLAGFNVTQGLARAETESEIYWKVATNELGEVVRDYDLIRVDGLNFAPALTSSWQFLATGFTNMLADTNPISGSNMRFYRAARHDRWRTNFPTRLASEEIYVAKPARLYPGQNWVAHPGIPDTNTASYLLGVDLPAGPTAGDPASTRVTWYARTTSETATNQIALVDGSPNEWVYTLGGAGSADDALIPVQDGFIVEIPTNGTLQTLLLIGRVPTNTLTQTLVGGQSYNFVNFRLPRRMHPGDMNLVESGFAGGNRFRVSDRIWRLNRQSQSVTELIWYNTTDSTWYRRQGQTDSALPANFAFEADDALVIFKRSAGDATWNLTPPYPAPTRFINP